jgi:hypothetical protein
MIPLLDAQLDLLSHRYQQALPKLASWTATFRDGVPERIQLLASADYAYCIAQDGDSESGMHMMSKVLLKMPKDIADDEMALLQHRQSQIALIHGEEEIASRHRMEANRLHRSHFNLQNQVVNELAEVSCPRN